MVTALKPQPAIRFEYQRHLSLSENVWLHRWTCGSCGRVSVYVSSREAAERTARLHERYCERPFDRPPPKISPVASKPRCRFCGLRQVGHYGEAFTTTCGHSECLCSEHMHEHMHAGDQR